MTTEKRDQTDNTRLNEGGVVAAVQSFWGTTSEYAVALAGVFPDLASATDWSCAGELLEQAGLSGKQMPAAAIDLAAAVGDLILLRHTDGYRLLIHHQKRWFFLCTEGLLLPVEDRNIVRAGDALEMRFNPEGPHPFFSSFPGLWQRLKGAWAEVGIASLFINTGQLILPVFSLLIYDKIALNGLFETLWALVIGMILYLVTDASMRLIRSWVTERISTDLTSRSDERIWEALLGQKDLPPGGFPRFLANYRDLTLSRDFVSSSYLLSVADIPFLLLYLIAIGLIAWQLMIVAMILVVIYGLVGAVLQGRLNERARVAEQVGTGKMAFMGESLNALDLLRTAPGSAFFLRQWRQLSESSAERDGSRRLAAQQLGMLASVMQTLTTVAILTTGVYLIHAQMMSTGKLIACNLLAGRGMATVGSLFAVLGKWRDFNRAASRMKESLAPVEEMEETPLPAISGQVAVIGVGKTYEGRPPALENISFSLLPGERVAMLGRPGAGKSTLIRILAGLSSLDAGQVQFDGLDLAHIARFDRIRWMAYKGQDPVVFAGTLEENLRVAGCREVERMQKALWAAGLEEEFKSGRMSLGMQLAERGNNLSGGQRQKVALARAFAQPAGMLLLDEPTLGLDPEGERLVAARLPQILDRTITLIMTTHSPTMLEIAGRVLALDGGKLVADGPREKLVTLTPRSPAGMTRPASQEKG